METYPPAMPSSGCPMPRTFTSTRYWASRRHKRLSTRKAERRVDCLGKVRKCELNVFRLKALPLPTKSRGHSWSKFLLGMKEPGCNSPGPSYCLYSPKCLEDGCSPTFARTA